jgi:hypothetical protein
MIAPEVLRDNVERSRQAMLKAGAPHAGNSNRGHMFVMSSLYPFEIDFSRVPYPHRDRALAALLGFVEAPVAEHAGLALHESLAQILGQKAVDFDAVIVSGWQTGANKVVRPHTVAMAADEWSPVGVIDSMHQDGLAPCATPEAAAAYIEGRFNPGSPLALSLALSKSELAELGPEERAVWLGNSILTTIPGLTIPEWWAAAIPMPVRAV